MLYIFLCVFGLIVSSNSLSIEETYAWKYLDYDWPSSDFKDEIMRTRSYIPENNLPIGIAPWKDKIFISVPRFKTGVPSSLNYIPLISKEMSPKLIPYPSWDANTLIEEQQFKESLESEVDIIQGIIEDTTDIPLNDNLTIVSVFRLWVDKCDRLWAFDSGKTDIIEGGKEIIKPTLLIFDLTTDTLIRKYTLKDSVFGRTSFFGHIVVDVEQKSCDDAFAYIADLGRGRLIVYNFRDDNSWMVKHHYFNFDPLSGQFDIGGIDFQWNDGIVGIALSKPSTYGSRRVFFHATASTKEFEVCNRILRNETWATSKQNFYDFKLLGDKGARSQSTASVYYEKGEILLFTQIQRNGLGCWHSKKPMTSKNVKIFVSSVKRLEFPSDMKIVDDRLWVLSNRLQKFVYRSLDKNEINFRIFNISMQDVTSICA